jgi:UDP-N-acetyl-D-mannosaminuronate dehydrogenase
VTFHDPYIKEWDAVERADDLDGACAAADLVILVQAHRAYDADRLAGLAKRFFDTRGVTTTSSAHRL